MYYQYYVQAKAILTIWIELMIIDACFTVRSTWYIQIWIQQGIKESCRDGYSEDGTKVS